METAPDESEEPESDAYPDEAITTPEPKPWMRVRVKFIPASPREPLPSSGDIAAPEDDA
ncbi:MAG TPA: hypothetical protein VFH99_02375 [Candidatus Saccharimonadales bacterium]|nr:hypothetical protein [Candidatus Saccharimonadales bacterium]